MISVSKSCLHLIWLVVCVLLIIDVCALENGGSSGALSTDAFNINFDEYNETEHMDRIVDAIGRGDARALQDMVFSGIDVNVESSQEVVPLLMAAYTAHLECIKILVEANAELDLAEGDGWTSLMFVAHAGAFDAVQYLVEQGADPFVTNNDDFTAYDIAHSRGFMMVAQYLADAELRTGIDNQNTDEVWTGLHHGAMRELSNRDGFTALLYFCSVGDFDAIEHLIQVRRSDYLVVEHDGWDCLMFSAYLGDVDSISLLLQLPRINEHNSVPMARMIAVEHEQYQALALIDDYIADNFIAV